MVRITLRVLSALVLLGIVFVPFVALAQPTAHAEVDSGNYHFEIGWLSEPVIVGERNGLELFVAKKDTPAEGLADITTSSSPSNMAGSAIRMILSPPRASRELIRPVSFPRGRANTPST